MNYKAEEYDVAVIGAGHAGIEAALASARLGCKTVIFTINMDSVGNLPCNPAIGGTAKGHLVFEIDALGGEMGKAADVSTIQSRMLNRGKGPAVHSMRVQVDRKMYSEYMKHTLEKQENLLLRQAEIVKIEKSDNGWTLTTRLGALHDVSCVIIATGTYLGGKVFVGDVNYESGPDGMFAATQLSQSMKELGLTMRRFKTGTPARVLKSSIDFSGLDEQSGDENPIPFSSATNTTINNKVKCYVSWTNDNTKKVIKENLHRSPLYGGMIEGVGPRYCPSIEDKIVRFPDKPRHQCFIEPCGINTDEMYLQGISSSLPEDVQISLYRTMDGMKNVKIMRSAYAIEYDCVDPTVMYPSLEFKEFEGLFGAGQFNGSSGYEEAAAQGLVAGINAARKVKKLEPVIFSRSNSYIGTLIDDLVTKGVMDPYRMMTSRSEYRLVLRQDNAQERLSDIGYEIGLLSKERYEIFKKNKELKYEEIERAKKTTISPSEKLNEILVSRETTPVETGVRLADLLKRPQINYKALEEVDITRPDIPQQILEQAEVEIKYEGYIKRQVDQINELKRLERKIIPKDIDYDDVRGLRLEAIEKLKKFRPINVGQASRISGVSPADVSVLMIYLKAKFHC